MDEQQVADASKYLFADVLAQGPVDRYWVPRTRPEDEANLVPGPFTLILATLPRNMATQTIRTSLEVKLKSRLRYQAD